MPRKASWCPFGDQVGWMAALWAGGLLLYLTWMFALLLHPVGRAQGALEPTVHLDAVARF